MRCERGSMREYAQSDDLKPNVAERLTGWQRGNVRGNPRLSATQHINPTSSECTPSPTPQISPKLGRNIEHWWYDGSPMNQSAVPLGSPSITPKLS